MITIKSDNTYKGTRFLVGNDKRDSINLIRNILLSLSFTEIEIPIIQHYSTFEDKVGQENNNLMFRFKDRGKRNLCLAPEYTAPVKELANSYYKQENDVKLFYVQECFRGEKPQFGRFRQFTQLGVEILNPSEDHLKTLGDLALKVCKLIVPEHRDIQFKLDYNVSRGLDYYEKGKGFEILCNALGSSKQVVGGGAYDEGIGFAIGLDRLILLK